MSGFLRRARKIESGGAARPGPGSLRQIDRKQSGGYLLFLPVTSLAARMDHFNGLLESEPVAQLVEQRTFNPLVVGSIPTGLTRK